MFNIRAVLPSFVVTALLLVTDFIDNAQQVEVKNEKNQHGTLDSINSGVKAFCFLKIKLNAVYSSKSNISSEQTELCLGYLAEQP